MQNPTLLTDAELRLPEREQRFLKTVREFARAEVAPNSARWEETEDLPREAFQRAAAAGLMGMNAPREYGGQGLSTVCSALAVVELARHDAAFALDLAAGNALGLGQILAFGTEDQRRRFATRLCSGELLGGWALTEPEAGSDSGGMRTEARPNGDGSWSVNGHKMYITQGRKADVLVVMAATGVTATGRKEISAFVVERDQVKGIRKIPTFGMRASETSELRFDDARAELLGTERGRGQTQALTVLDRGRIGVAAVSVGIMHAAFAVAVRHATKRHQFGKPLAELQSIQNMLADSAVDIAAAEGLLLRAAEGQDLGRKTTKESAVAKLHASEAGSRVCNRAMQILGGRGYSREFPVERHLRDAKLCEIGEGASEIQRMVIARNVIKEHDARLAEELAAAGGLVETAPNRETALAGPVHGR